MAQLTIAYEAVGTKTQDEMIKDQRMRRGRRCLKEGTVLKDCLGNNTERLSRSTA
jgi:hypothetical protein